MAGTLTGTGQVQETPTSVTVAVFVNRAPARQPCNAIYMAAVATVELATPLGRRRLVHAPVTG